MSIQANYLRTNALPFRSLYYHTRVTQTFSPMTRPKNRKKNKSNGIIPLKPASNSKLSTLSKGLVKLGCFFFSLSFRVKTILNIPIITIIIIISLFLSLNHFLFTVGLMLGVCPEDGFVRRFSSMALWLDGSMQMRT